MPEPYLTPAAIGYLTQLILLALISGYFLWLTRQPQRPRPTIWLTAFIAALN